ncbi:hypothetical protein [Kitasatospora griseola]|uniref:hypothetical protein n=1 Tax=Kitasatospora griseola TaxID=2064 RepID=UPI003422A277
MTDIETRVCIDSDLITAQAVVDSADLWSGAVRPRFTLATARQLATDTAQVNKDYGGGYDTVHVIDGPAGSEKAAVVLVVGWQHLDPSDPAGYIEIVARDQDGLYAIGAGGGWLWTVATWLCLCGEPHQWPDRRCRACGNPRPSHEEQGEDATDDFLTRFAAGALTEAARSEAQPSPGDPNSAPGRCFDDVARLGLGLHSLPGEQRARFLEACAWHVEVSPEVRDLDPVHAGAAWWLSHRGRTTDGSYLGWSGLSTKLSERLHDNAGLTPPFGKVHLDDETGSLHFA